MTQLFYQCLFCYRTRTNGFESPKQPHYTAHQISLAHTMIPSRSTPNLRDNKTTSVYSYLQNQSGLNFAPVSTAPPTRDEDSPPPAPPVRDSSSLKSIKYGPGHEKFPSWPVPAAADTPQVRFLSVEFSKELGIKSGISACVAYISMFILMIYAIFW